MIRRFNRFELKFIVPGAVKDALQDVLLRHMTFDAHGDRDGAYRVSSLYYDSPDFACFRAKVEGIKYRRKLRLRIYGDDASIGSAEIKQRINRTVQKRRVALPMEQAVALCAGVNPGNWDRDDDAEVAHEITFLVEMLRLQPACIISYLRQAYVGSEYEPGLRITFDGELGYAAPSEPLNARPSRHFMPPDRFVMEVKVNERVPLWVTRMLANHRCHLTRISKYCAGLAQLQSMSREYDFFQGEQRG